MQAATATDPRAAAPLVRASEVSGRLRRDGFCILRGALPTPVLDEALAAYDRHLLAYTGSLKRQSQRRERHRIGPSGGLVNALVDLHREGCPPIEPFRRAVLGVVGHHGIAERLRCHFGGPARAVSLHWLDESKNGPHQDQAYEDSVPPGQLVGLLVPMWDAVGPAHNRFFVVPGSADALVPHDAESLRSGDYIRDVYAAVADRHDGRLTPLDLARGDAVLFSSRMIHGTILGTSGRLPRIAAHFLPEDAVYRGFGFTRPIAVREYGLPLTGAV